MKFKEDFVLRCKALYPKFETLHKALDCGAYQMVGRCLDDNTPTFTIEDLDKFMSIEEVHEASFLAKEHAQLSRIYSSGECFESREEFEKSMCPRHYGQNTNRDDVLRVFSFQCNGYLPDCANKIVDGKRKGDTCWAKFHEKGL